MGSLAGIVMAGTPVKVNLSIRDHILPNNHVYKIDITQQSIEKI